MTVAHLAFERVDNPNETGLSTDKIKPITEQGVKVMANDAVPVQNPSGWGFLDQVWGGIQEGVSSLAGIKIQQELIRQGVQPTGVKVDTTGQVSDQPMGQVNETSKSAAAQFVEKYKTPLMIGAALLVAGSVFLIARK